MSFIVEKYRDIIRQNRNSKLIKLGYKIASNFMIAYHNESYFDMKKNGELHIIKCIKKKYDDNRVIVFDIGANHGEYTILINQQISNSSIHCFEIVPQTFEILKEKLYYNTNIILNNFGLSDSARELQVSWYPQEDSGSSISPLPWKLNCEKVDCEVTSGNEYCQNNNIEKIDFLKIDTEGHELFVLNGFNKLLNSGKISIIQFEYGLTYIPSRTTLGNIYNFLEPLGYLIGRVYPNGVEFKQYNLFEDETFKAGNYIAVHQSATELINLVKINKSN